MVDLADELELSDPQTRVLGALLEKKATTPDAYPLTLKALVDVGAASLTLEAESYDRRAAQAAAEPVAAAHA